MKTFLAIFATSFGLNFVWEHLHAPLYAHYQGGPITDFILLHASLGDAVMITLMAWPFVSLSFFKTRPWLVVPLGLVVAVVLELWALQVGRWNYNELMPLIPFLKVGLTPTIQLAATGYATLLLLVRK